jgi:hypothetical protein
VLNVRKVVVYELLSLDGVAEKPDGFFADWDDVMGANLGAVIAAQDSVILGRRSYEEWGRSGDWRTGSHRCRNQLLGRKGDGHFSFT